MKLQNPDVPTPIIHGVGATADFTIQAGAQAFAILSSGLYSDPIKAIVRELSTNAWDGQVDNNLTDKAFDVSLPTPLSPVFILRDYGIGMSHDDVMGLYSTYFGSDKGDSNKKIGALGLGSKSPLGYTNNFTVESIQQGVHNSYMIYLNDDGMPTIAHTGTLDTDEADGVTITIPTEDNDTHKWDTAAQEIYKWFPVLPNFLTSDPRIPERETYDHNFGGIHSDMDSNRNHWSNEWHIIQGLIAYPLDTDKFDTVFFQHFSGEIHVELGEVMFAPNRESINYNAITVNAIQNYIDKFDTEFMDRQESHIKGMDSMTAVLEFGRNFNIGYNKIDKYPNLELLVQDRFKEMNEAEKFYWPSADADFDAKVELFYTETFEYSSTQSYFMPLKYFLASLTKHISSEYRALSIKAGNTVVSGAINDRGHGFDHVSVIFNDGKRGIIGKAREYLRENGKRNTLVLVVEGSKLDNAGMVSAFKKLGYDDMAESSTIPELNIPKTAYKKLQGTRFARLEHRPDRGGYNSRDKTAWNRGLKAKAILDEDTDVTRFWVTVKGAEITDAERAEIDKMVMAYGQVDLVLEVYGVKEKDAASMVDLDGWSHFNDYKANHIYSLLNKADFVIHAKYHALHDFRNFVNAITDDMIKDITCPDLLAVIKHHKSLVRADNYRVRKAFDHESFGLKELHKVSTKKIDKHLEVLYNIPTLKRTVGGWGFGDTEMAEIISLVNQFSIFNTGVTK